MCVDDNDQVVVKTSMKTLDHYFHNPMLWSQTRDVGNAGLTCVTNARGVKRLHRPSSWFYCVSVDVACRHCVQTSVDHQEQPAQY